MEKCCQNLLSHLAEGERQEACYFARFKNSWTELNEREHERKDYVRDSSDEVYGMFIDQLLKQIKQRQDYGGLLYAQYREITLL